MGRCTVLPCFVGQASRVQDPREEQAEQPPLELVKVKFLNECFYLYPVHEVTAGNSSVDCWKEHQDDFSVFLH